jgi:ParB family transcriptional regulator, chromosome partitioning protein
MSRKNLLTSLTERKLTAVNPAPAAESLASLTPAMERNRSRGAFGAITKSIDELAEKAQAAKEFEARLLEGATVIELDPATIDASFVADRMSDDRQAFEELVEAIRQRGQDSPILVRPHPTLEGRYMTVFGHRRARAARALGRPVKAVVKKLDDKDHVIAQGQENSARADLSFIEKAVFASSLELHGYDREVIMAALSVDKTVVSKMISVTNDIPASVIAAIGPAKNSGRDRWYKLAIKFRDEDARRKALELTETAKFQSVGSDERMDLLTQHLESEEPRAQPKKIKDQPRAWASADNSVSATLKKNGKTATIAIGAVNGIRFADWISGQLDTLYEEFTRSQKSETGD